jgi:predicted RNA-binding Zn-ribbon protein involved in translation (DUF1610 family)
MDSRLQGRVRAMVLELAREEQARLRSAGTMVELEELACEIGDEFTNQLMSLEMGDRANEAAEAVAYECPDCGQSCGQVAPKARKLSGLRGKVGYSEPTFYCPACRRSFFPVSGQGGPCRPGDGDTEVATENGLGGIQPKQL